MYQMLRNRYQLSILSMYKILGPNYPCKETDYYRRCNGCNKAFHNQSCYETHLKSFCAFSKQCRKCGVVFRNDEGHECNTKYCAICKTRHPKDQLCYIQQHNVAKKPAPYRLITFDFESEQIDSKHHVGFPSKKLI